MKVAVVGLGIQGKKRHAIAGGDVAATVDPVQSQAQYKSVESVPRRKPTTWPDGASSSNARRGHPVSPPETMPAPHRLTASNTATAVLNEPAPTTT